MNKYLKTALVLAFMAAVGTLDAEPVKAQSCYYNRSARSAYNGYTARPAFRRTFFSGRRFLNPRRNYSPYSYSRSFRRY